MSFIAGHYTATWNGTSIGTTENGFRLTAVHHHEPVITDEFGDAPVDGIQRGTEYRLTLEFMEYDLVKAALFAQGAIGTMKSNVGKTLKSLAQQLVLTVTAGTPAAGAGNISTLTAPKAIVVSDFDLLLSSRLRKGPVTFHLFPTDDTKVAFTTT
jgi:hypothetical protein